MSDIKFHIGTGFNDKVHGLVVDRRGRYVCVGEFTNYNGESCIRIARINPDGSLDKEFRDNTGTGLYGASVTIPKNVKIDSQNRIIIGGCFTAFNGTLKRGLVRLNDNGTIDSTFNSGNAGFNATIIATGFVNGLAIDNQDKIYVGGDFTTYNSINVYSVVRINEDGSLDTDFVLWTHDIGKNVYDIAIDNNGDIYAVGEYALGSGSIAGILKLNISGNTALGWTDILMLSTDTEAWGITIDDSDNGVYVTGNFYAIYGYKNGIEGAYTTYETLKLNENGTLYSGYTGCNYMTQYPDGGVTYVYGLLIDTGTTKLYTHGGQVYFSNYGSTGYTTGYLYLGLNSNGNYDNSFDLITSISGVRVGAGEKASQWAADGNIIRAGGFTNLNGTGFTRIVLMTPDGEFITDTGNTITPNAITGLTSSNITTNSIDLDWVNNQLTGVTNIIIERFYNNCWYDLKTLSSGDTSTTLTGLTYGTQYILRASIIFNDTYYSSESITATTINIIEAPTGLTATPNVISCKLDWTNITYNDGIYVYYKLTGSTGYIKQATLNNTIITYTITGLSANTSYNAYIATFSGATELSSNTVTFTTNNIQAPSGVTMTEQFCDGWTLSWINNGDVQGDIEVWWLDLSVPTWKKYASYPPNTTTMTFTGMTRNQGGLGHYSIRVANVVNGYYYNSDILNNCDAIAVQPITNLTGFTSGCTQCLLTWDNPPCVGTILVQRQSNTGSTTIATLTNGETQYLVTGLTIPSTINYQIANWYGSTFYTSSPWTYETPLYCQTLNKFCELSNPYTVTNSTCGNMDGTIVINSDGYTEYYDFILTDVFGTQYPLWNNKTYYVTAGYYFLVAVVKPEYWGTYGRDNCVFQWIKVDDTNTTLSLNGVSVKSSQCGPFDYQSGRIFYDVNGFNSAHTYSFYSFRSDMTGVAEETGITNKENFILTDAGAYCYYTIIIDEDTLCHLVISPVCIPSQPIFSQGGLKKLYLLPWSNDVDYNYWKTSDEDYFLEFEDTSFFTSTKIKEYLSLSGGSLQWYELPIQPQVATVNQKLEKIRQGFIFTDNLTIAIAKGNATKWTQMATLINPENKWIYVVQDADGFWWTGGYQFGAKVTAYSFKTGARGEDNGYQLTITAVSENKLLTSLNEDYVNTYIK